MTISTSQLILAYRKAKVDLYYSTNPPLLAMADYEADLPANLANLQARINGESEAWIHERSFLGDWTLAPKAIKPADLQAEHKAETGLIFASPTDEWANMATPQAKPIAQFRLMAQCSLDFHVLSALWMLEVGHLFDKQLSDNVYGGRLRRNRYNEINPLALGSFKPYLKPFRDWRDGGIKSMRSALSDKKKVIALTADISSFYHELNPGFMLDRDFHTLANVGPLNDAETKLNRLFINALQSWAQETPLKKGLPVGLPASAVAANAALIQLDQFIQRQVVPLYYGRYVDDILLVMENTSDIKTTGQFWEWIFNRDGGRSLLREEDRSILFTPDYLKGDRIAFENSKNKLFVLSGSPGTALVNAISEQINQRASEWRALPNLPDSPGTIATDLLKATNHAGEQADNLRKTDALSLHRAGFALNLRDFEAYERDLPPEAWQAHRHAFFEAVIDHLLKPVKFFELAQYLPRIVRMATACEDFEQLGKIIEALKTLMRTIGQECNLTIKGMGGEAPPVDSIVRWQQALKRVLAQSVVCAFPPRLSQAGMAATAHLLAKQGETLSEGIWADFLQRPLEITHKHLQKRQADLFSHDLAHIPLRFVALPREMVSQRGIPFRTKLVRANWQEIPHTDINQGIHTLAGWFKPKLAKGIPAGLYFATRPFSLNELYLIAPTPFSATQQKPLDQVMSALRGFDLNAERMPHWDKHKHVLRIPDGEPEAQQTIAVASWETHDQSFIAAAMRQPDPDSRRRYQRLNHLINELISRPDGASYLILPELALPPQWFMRIAEKLKGRGISLITGVEYLHAPKKRVHNQIWASLTHDGLGFPSLMLYRQDKQTPAFHEEQELFRLSGVSLKPAVPWQSPPLIQHGDFHFALLNCSELTNIRYRAELRGQIDALFVPEWNSDTDTFNALVESAALDIHAYIVQCNNRQFGDSRIRAPYKDRWKRDILRVKGGNHDYCITGEIDVLALRQFQSSYRAPASGFKPVPDGFYEDMAPDRKVLPKGA
ncbi:reverse transcriptase domain-containing protein [Stutzerimonas nitrititolerans]|uniref:reverse transcriptase domain-containing protein n=1 Tax=Stutzerimonas nitrititolerans TaxID=2482751 RepID=UPI00289FED24|nr:reverse transcriptase domain-containing protein [Stutzerimonas nitrititolerans]